MRMAGTAVMTQADAARALAITRERVRQLLEEGKLSPVTVRGHRRVSAYSVCQLQEKRIREAEDLAARRAAAARAKL